MFIYGIYHILTIITLYFCTKLFIMKIARQISIVLLAVTAATAIYSSYHFILDPTGHTIGYSLADIKGSPFKDYLIPGWLMLIFLGLGSVVSCGLTMQEEESYTSYIMGQGAICMLWVIVQIVMLQRLTIIQIAFVIIGTALLFSGKRIRKQLNNYHQVSV